MNPIDKQRAYINSLEEESDRGCVLLATEHVNEILEAVHRAHIVMATKSPKKFADDLFKWPGPLSSFAARIQLGYAYGIITKVIFLDLERLRKLRNEAAHSNSPFKFVDKLDMIAEFGNESPTLNVAMDAADKSDKKAKGSIPLEVTMKKAFMAVALALSIDLVQAHESILRSHLNREKNKASKSQ